MGTSSGAIVKYRCFNDCQESGCPGHEVRACFHRTSDVLYFEIDGKPVHHFDENLWRAMLESEKSLRNA